MDLPSETLDLAIRVHRSGQFAEAEALYRRILEGHPDHPEVLQLIGVLAHQRRNIG